MDKLTEILEAQHVGLKSSIMNGRFVLSVYLLRYRCAVFNIEA
ncbi:hypothetical protein [Paenibacillus sp. FSL H8-0259]|nr:hypothetical protein [Paenibacillus sp. FSL H8-0259]